MRTILSLIVVFLSLSCFSQDQDAWVYFTDKPTDVYSLANPITFLTQKAIDRKNAHGVAIDDRDVPVDESYITQLKSQTGITVMAKSKWLNAVHVRGAETDIKALSSLGFVSTIDFADKSLNTVKLVKQKSESKFQETFVNFNYGSSANQIQMLHGDQLHLADYTGTGMTIAVLDAGFPNVGTMASFARLRNANHILGTYDFVNRDTDVYTNTTSNHGTMVLSTMAGYVQDAFVGTAPDASYYLFITEDAPIENPVEESYWVEAAEHADSLGVDVINSSLGYGSFYDNPNYNYAPSDFDGLTAFITRGANIAYQKGLLIVNSAGNEGNAGVNAPADSPYVFSIGAVDSNGNYASFSSEGSAIQPTQKPDVVAQGQASYVINENDVIGTANGTSFSSPIMAGGVTCLWQALPDKSNGEIMQLIRESASQYASPDYFLGYGIPDLQLALNTALSITINSTGNQIKLFPNPVLNKVSITFPKGENTLEVSVFNILGKRVLKAVVTPTNNQLDFSKIQNGMYIANIKSKSGEKSFKLIKQ